MQKFMKQQEEGHKVEEKSLMGMEKAFEKLKKFVLQTNVSNMDEKERLSENDSCGDMELHVSPIVNNQCHDEKELLVNFQYEHASRADFLTLGPRQELLDVIIMYLHANLIVLRTNSKEYGPTRCYYSHHICENWQLLPDVHTYYQHMDEMNDCNKIYIPMHDTCPNHWYLCVINLHQHNIHILDSLPSIERDDMRTSSVRTVVEECANFFNLNGHLKNLSSVPIERPTWVDVQANGWDCGVHVINHMRRSDFMDSSSTPSHWDSTAIRHKLGNRITS
ncbi:hypothetical protein CK203_075304 [Vitis vinifera]|uniref:Ubiquitin-like protease family profile domain-containing protein n=1 Tax=Vitis vinifera TaxID=29760 RepID=A0A438BXE1_VITVI|nr:hypothetical protein CK203_075304 [Vitis vinifera]